MSGPYVVLDVDLVGSAFELVLANIGDEPAHQVRVELSPPLTALGGELDLSTLPLFRRLGVLRPSREIRVFLDPAPAAWAREPQQFTACVRFRDAQGKERERTYEHDLGAFRDLPRVGPA